MTNKEFLKRASKLQREFAELYENTELVTINVDNIHVTKEKFHELEKEGILEHISKALNKAQARWDYEAMTPQGVKIIALEYLAEMEKK